MKAQYLRATSALALGLSLAMSGHSVRAQQTAEGGLALEEITVTARRVEENLMVVPTSVATLSSKDLEDMGLKDMTQISTFSPGFHFINQVGGQSGLNDRSQTTLTFRGLTLNSGAGSLFVDGAPVASSQAPPMDQVARVEVLKGPQSVYFGRATFTGAINYVTKDPSMDRWKGSVSGEYASYGSNDESISLEGPLVADKLSIRVNGHHYFHGGNYVNGTNTTQRLGDQTTDSVSASIVFTPNDKLHVKAFLDYFTNNDGVATSIDIRKPDGFFNCNPTGGQYVGGFLCGEIPTIGKLNPINISEAAVMTPFLQSILVKNVFNFPLPYPAGWLDHFGLKRHDLQGSLRVDYELSSFTISSLTAYDFDKIMSFADPDERDGYNVENRYNTVLHLPNTVPQYTFNLGVERLTKDWSQELRIASDQKERFRYTFGGNYLYVTSPGMSLFGLTALGPLDLGGITHAKTITPAVFGGLTYDIMQDLTVSGEARYQWDILTNVPIYSGTTALTGLAAKPLHGTFKSFSPRVSLDYKYAPDSTVYVLWSRGYRPGGFNAFVQTNTDQTLAAIRAAGGTTNLTYLQEKLDNFEGGLKSTFLEGRARTTLAIYYDKWRNGQIPTVVNYLRDPNNPLLGAAQVSPVINAGAINMKGVEFSGDFLVSRQFKVSGNLALNSTKVLFFQPCTDALHITGASTCNGAVPAAPKWSWTMSGDYHDHLAGDYDWFARFDYFHVGKQYADYTNLAWIGAADTFNLHLGVRNEVLTIEGYVKNLTNDDHAVGATSQVDGFTFLTTSPAVPQQNDIRLALPDKRTFGLRAKYNF